jgi:D-aspartate ligase
MKNRLDKFIKQCKQSGIVPTVVMGSSVNGLSYLRSLGQKNVPTLCLDYYHGSASKSRYGHFVLLEAQPGEDITGEGAADQLFQILNEKGIKPVVFGIADEWQVYIARRNASPTPPFLSLSPSQQAMETIIDKQAQYELATRLDIAVPQFANAVDVLTGKSEWRAFPAIIKPRWAHLGREAIGGKALLVSSAVALQESLANLSTEVKIADYIVQKVLQGTDNCLYSYLGFFVPAGYEFTGLVKRKLRQYPPLLGDGSYDMTCIDEPLAQAARKLLAAIDYQGLVGVEFKRDPGSDDFGLIEINPRTVSTNQLAINAGIDFPWIAYQMIVHLNFPDKMPRPQAPTQYKVGYHHINEERDFNTFLIRRKQGELGFWKWFKSVVTAESFALWNKKDPWPFLNMVASKIGKRFRRSLT